MDLLRFFRKKKPQPTTGRYYCTNCGKLDGKVFPCETCNSQEAPYWRKQ